MGRLCSRDAVYAGGEGQASAARHAGKDRYRYACRACGLASSVVNNNVSGRVAAVLDARTHTHTHTHIQIYIEIHIYSYMYAASCMLTDLSSCHDNDLLQQYRTILNHAVLRII